MIDTLTQNERYKITDDKKELQDAFIERVENTLNTYMTDYNAELIDIKYLYNSDNMLSCIYTLKMNKKDYNKYYGL